MRLIDVDNITDEDICNALGLEYSSCLFDIREMLDEQPTVNPQCIATVKVDFSKEDIEKLVEQKVKESIDINVDGLKELLMEYFHINNFFMYNYGMMFDGDFVEFDESTIDDIIEFIRENT